MDLQNLPVCPKCHQTDQIQKVTSLYGLNTKDWVETHSSTDGHGHSYTTREEHEAHTQLGLKLAPPPQPSGPSHPGIWYAVGGLVGFIFLSVFCSLATIPLAFIIPLFTAAAFIPDLTKIPNWVILASVAGGGTVFGVLAGIGLLVWLGFVIKRRFDRDMANYRAKKVFYEQEQLPPWQRARERWEQLYYCLRDETVFIPAENRAVALADLTAYLYNPAITGDQR